MIKSVFAKLKRHEKGFTLVELVVSLSILGFITVAMTAASINIMRISSQNTEWNVNMRQVQNAGYWISRDALMAQTVEIDKPNVFLSFSWGDWSGNSYNVDYVLDESNRLIRQLNGSSTILIAEYIVPADTTCEWIDEENRLKVIITASLNGPPRYAQRTYEISPRPVAMGD